MMVMKPHGKILMIHSLLEACVLIYSNTNQNKISNQMHRKKWERITINIVYWIMIMFWALCQVYFLIEFFFFFWERKWESVSGGQRERQRISSRFHAQCGVQLGARSHDCEIMTWAEIKRQLLNWLRHPGSPSLNFYKWLFVYPFCGWGTELWEVGYLCSALFSDGTGSGPRSVGSKCVLETGDSQSWLCIRIIVGL